MRLRVRAFDRDVGLVLAAWIALLGLEHLVVGVRCRDEIAGTWETATVWRCVVAIAIGVSIPFALALAGVGRLVASRRAHAVAALAAIAGAAVAFGVSTGRHMANPAVRGAFVVAVSAVAAVVAFIATRRVPLDRPRTLAAIGAAVACVAWVADGAVLPRLYPAFHAALFATTLAAWALVVLPLRARRSAPAIALVGIVASTAALAWSPRAARVLAAQDNVRRVLAEHAPMLGRSVVLAARFEKPPPLDDDASADALLTRARGNRNAAVGRSLDWTGRDIVLVTIDALRADHVSSYGYPRPTTPNIDRLAARGARFAHAYCPTPHTSYSVASLMAGKYMRPLLAMGAPDDAETWASLLRRYAFRTAAFYPPAVFFVDTHRFPRMQATGLGFEYRKEEFATPPIRRAQVAEYLSTAPVDKPLFLWVHIFEPHEPYEMHPEHPFSGDPRSDAYDSEIATADALVGDIVGLVEDRRPGAVVVVSADHGEELGDHGGRYHGTTVYEEQVRVPLVVVGPGVAPRVVDMPVQTIDLLPTALAALDIPRPARLRGKDLGPALTGRARPDDQGFAFAETEDWTLVARGNDRLVCARKLGSCTLFDVAVDPVEKHPVQDEPDRVEELRKLTAAIERENGRVEASSVPPALRRCLQGDRDAAVEVAALLDDVRADIRRDAARCAFRLRASEIAPQLRRAAARDEDARVRTFSTLALARIDDDGSAAAEYLHDEDRELRLAGALVLAEHGDARGEGELVARWRAAFVPGAHDPGELDEARELAAAFAKIRARAAVPALVRSLEDVRLRPFVVDTLAAIGDARAKEPLLATFTGERYLNVRAVEAKALVRLGAKDELFRPLARFAGVPEAVEGALAIAADADLLRPELGGWIAPAGAPRPEETVELSIEPGEGPARLFVRTAGPTPPTASVGDAAVTPTRTGGDAEAETWMAEVADVRGPRVHVTVAHDVGVGALWLVRRAAEIPPPPPRDWDAGGVAPSAAAEEGPL